MPKVLDSCFRFGCGALGLALMLVFTGTSTGHENHQEASSAPVKVDAREIYKPTPVPDRIILTWTGDPAHTQAVTWRTDDSVAKGLAQIAEAGPGPRFAENAVQVAATQEELVSDAGTAHYHAVNFAGLKPGTKYAYRVGDGANWSEWFHFTTASERPEPFSFIYFGDAQNDIRMHWSRVVRGAIVAAPKARFMLHAGDLVNRGNVDYEWGEWFHAGGWLNAMIPSVATPGNHEYPLEATGRALSRHWRPQFALPTNGPSGLEESVYALDFQGTRLISLNSNEAQQRQNKWLEEQLADNPNRWTIVTFHHPVYSAKESRDNPEIRGWWKPIFDRYRVDLVLNGHDHSYARTGFEVPDKVARVPGPIPAWLRERHSAIAALNGIVDTVNESTGVMAQSAEGGTVYVVSVSGPKMYDVDRKPYMKRAGQGLQLYQIIHVDGDRLRYEAHTAAGDLYDAFTLAKRPSGKNELIEQAPESPEVLPVRPPKAAPKSGPRVSAP